MPRDIAIKIIRSTRANLNTQKSGSNLLVGELYQVTDETPNKLCMGIAVNDYVDVGSGGTSAPDYGMDLATRNLQCFNNVYS